MKEKIFYEISAINFDDDKIIYKNYNSTINKMFQLQSISKFITSLIVAKLYELGKINYETDINKYLKKWKCPIKGITLKHLLSHTSGADESPYNDGELPQKKMKQTLQLNIDILNGKYINRPFRVIDKIGKKFMYSNPGYQLIQQIVEEITGKPLYKLMEKYIFKPLKMMNSTGKLLYDNKHNYNLASYQNLYRMFPDTAAAGVWSSSGDLLKLGLDLLNGYNKNESKILSQLTIKMIIKPIINLQKNFSWSMGMMVGKINGDLHFGHGGSSDLYENIFVIFPEKKKIVIILTHHNPKYYPNNIISEKEFWNKVSKIIKIKHPYYI